jgi:hypothetical protein
MERKRSNNNMESATAMPWLSWPQKPRRGQEKAFVWAFDGMKIKLVLNQPTAYGKTMVANGTLTLLYQHRDANRGLLIVPQEGQHDQYVRNCIEDFAEVGMVHNRDFIVLDLRKSNYRTIAEAMLRNRDKLIVYVITIQMLHTHTLPNKRDHERREILSEVFGEPNANWVFVIDEYHHYGVGTAWSEVFKILPKPIFLLAMSATPFRAGQDDYFGDPDIRITYRDAVDEGAVKPLTCHVYDYWIEMEDKDGPYRLTTRQHDDLVNEAAAHSEITAPMRYREDYIAPLLESPLDRLLETRARDFPWAQAIGRRCRHVYLRDDRIACRKCFRLDYAVRHLRRQTPAIGRVERLRRKLGDCDIRPFAPLPPRKRGRSQAIHDRLVAAIQAEEERLVGHLGGSVHDLQRRIRIRKAKKQW